MNEMIARAKTPTEPKDIPGRVIWNTQQPVEPVARSEWGPPTYKKRSYQRPFSLASVIRVGWRYSLVLYAPERVQCLLILPLDAEIFNTILSEKIF